MQPAQRLFDAAVNASDNAPPGAGTPLLAQRACLQGSDLPSRWADRAHFTVMETGLGECVNFLATWDAWRRDAQRCTRLHFVLVTPQLPTRAALALALASWSRATFPLADLAAQLLQAWPPCTTNLHALDFEQGQVQLLLAVGEATLLLPKLRLAADAFLLGGAQPEPGEPLWPLRLLKAVGRLAAPQAHLASDSVDGTLHAGLVTAGFEFLPATAPGEPRTNTVARFAPRFAPPRLPSAAVPDASHAIVVGAGLAGAAAAQALVRQGLQVTVLEQHSGPALEASGNPAGLFHGTLNADDGLYARLFRAAAQHATREYRPCIAAGLVPGCAAGLLRLETRLSDVNAMRALLARLDLPADYVSAVDRAQASELAGVGLPGPAWLYPGGGWVSPPAWVRQALAAPGVRVRYGVAAQALVRDGQDWCVQDGSGHTLARAPIVVLAHAASVATLLAPLGHSPWPLQRTRGQVTHGSVAQDGAAAQALILKLPVAGDGYALPMAEGRVLCGATRQVGDEDPSLRDADHRLNLAGLRRLTGLALDLGPAPVQGRVGWRQQADDRLPIAGAMPSAQMPGSQRMDQARLLPRERGLFVLTALGARGLTLAPLLARLVAAQATGTPWPLEQTLVDAVDPARWRVRAARAPPGG